MNRAYFIQLYPNQKQAELLDKHFGCARWVYNKMIEINQKKYHRTGKSLSGYDMQSYLPKLKKQYPWLAEVNSQSLQIVCHNLADAYGRFLKKQSGYPKFKRQNGQGSFSSINDSALLDKHIKLPKLKLIRYRGGDCPQGQIKRFIVSKSAGKYYASVIIETLEKEPPLDAPNKVLGIDLGIKDIIITSVGDIYSPSKLTKRYQVKLRAAQKALSRCQKTSKRRAVARLNVAKIHRKIGDSRKDFNHKLSRILVNEAENQSFAVENLNVKGMMANHKLAKSIADAGWYQFLTFLNYKAAAVGKPVLEVGRFFPSSKTCSACGIVKESLKLSEREWVCGSCGISHQRDINAALNIALEAARNAVHGNDVIPSVLR